MLTHGWHCLVDALHVEQPSSQFRFAASAQEVEKIDEIKAINRRFRSPCPSH